MGLSSSGLLQVARCIVAAAAVCIWAGPAAAKVWLTTAEALAAAYPGCTVVRQTFYLDQAQQEAAAQAAGVDVPSRLVPAYVATCGGRPGGVAYFDTSRVRTLPATLLVALDDVGALLQVRTVSFDEPQEYAPPTRWLDLFAGKRLDDELRLKRGVDAISGATLTSRASVNAVRRVLALHAVLFPRPPADAQTPGTTTPK